MTSGPAIPFFLMEGSKKFRPGTSPENRHDEIAGLKKAVEKTKARILEYEAEGKNASEFKTHLNFLQSCLKNLEEKR